MVNDNLIKLREQMALNNLDAFVIFTADPHASEYPAKHWKFREYISGFTGSAGTVVVTRHHAGLWTDSRYYLQAEAQLAGSGIELHKDGMPGVPDFVSYLTYLLPSGSRVGLDGFTISIAEYRKMEAQLANFGIELDGYHDFSADLFAGREALPSDEVRLVEKEFECMTRQEKIALVRRKMNELGATHYLVASLDDIAWLTNLRGSDVEYNPVFYAYMIITSDDEHLYINPHKLTSALSHQLEVDGLHLSLYEHYERNLGNIPSTARVYYDPARANARNIKALPAECVRLEGPSLIAVLKAQKTEAELRHIEDAHLRDGVAMVRFLRWLKTNVGREPMTELSVSDKLTEIRSRGAHYISNSFENIVAYGSNAAIVHYAATLETDAKVEPQGLMLIDSGAQYADGTTDITRTVALGPVSDKEKLHYTLVLKGHIALATAVFPEGTRGVQLDSFARQAMWRFGADYGHGTGHGVGYCLNVHEGPQNIGKRDNGVAMAEGMVTSNEPGIYVAGSHGIRTENLTVCALAKKTEFGRFLTFRTISLCPIDLAPVVVEKLTIEEIRWLDDYHNMVFSKLSPLLEEDEKEWLREACKPLFVYRAGC